PFLFQRPLNRSLQFPDFNMGNFTNGNSLPGITDSSSLATGNSATGLFDVNNHLALTSISSGNASNTATGTSPITSPNPSSTNSASAQQTSAKSTGETLTTNLALGTPASSAKLSSTPKGPDSFMGSFPPKGSESSADRSSSTPK